MCGHLFERVCLTLHEKEQNNQPQFFFYYERVKFEQVHYSLCRGTVLSESLVAFHLGYFKSLVLSQLKCPYMTLTPISKGHKTPWAFRA